MAVRTGLSFPFGNATGNSADTLSRRYAWQIPIAFDLGAKITRSIFVGTYLQVGFGAEGSDNEVAAFCDDNDENFSNDVSCSVLTARLGLLMNYQFSPDKVLNPWIGYGIGFESASQSLKDKQHGYSESTTVSGLTYAQLSGGFDFRGAVGVGPYAEIALGAFSRTSTEQYGRKVYSGSIDDRALHAWVTLGVRFVVRP
ncbi:MAG TPA: hypothetical protein VFQ35_08245 [Polyangiaceae bacterium]|nr:hypothetical protein [Polyangiaceae bacterium]